MLSAMLELREREGDTLLPVSDTSSRVSEPEEAALMFGDAFSWVILDFFVY